MKSSQDPKITKESMTMRTSPSWTAVGAPRDTAYPVSVRRLRDALDQARMSRCRLLADRLCLERNLQDASECVRELEAAIFALTQNDPGKS